MGLTLSEDQKTRLAPYGLWSRGGDGARRGVAAMRAGSGRGQRDGQEV